MSDGLKTATIEGILRDVPRKLVADWDCTNHYEIHDTESGSDDFFFICLADYMNDCYLNRDTEEGKKLGQILDMAAALPDAMTIIRQLLEQKKILQDALDFYANVNFYSPKNYVKVLLNDQGSKARHVLKEVRCLDEK